MTTNYTGAGRKELTSDSDIDYAKPVLRRYSDAAAIRNATPAETRASRDAAESDGGAGVIDVDGESYYVEE